MGKFKPRTLEIYRAGNGFIVNVSSPSVIREGIFGAYQEVKPEVPYVFHSVFDLSVFLVHFFYPDGVGEALAIDDAVQIDSPETIGDQASALAEVKALKSLVRKELLYVQPRKKKKVVN